jgi:Na+-transporting NADH:ubiquinone oxidoreductase subunit NqrD
MFEMVGNKTEKFFLKSLTEIIKLFFGEEYLHSKIVIALLISALSVNILDWLLLAFFLRLPKETIVILHYNVYFGVDVTGNVKQTYFLPLIGLILLVINVFLAGYFYKLKERIAAYVFLITTLAIQLSLLISVASVIIINYK